MILKPLNKEIKKALFCMQKAKNSESESYWEGYLNALEYVKKEIYTNPLFNQSLRNTEPPENSQRK